MSVFKNVTSGDIWIETEDGGNRSVKYNQTFSGSNFYKRYTSDTLPLDQVILVTITDDGLPWAAGGVANVLRSIEASIPPNSHWGDFYYDFTPSSVLGGPAIFLQVIVEDAAVRIKINSQDGSAFTMDAGTSQVFNTNELLVSNISFINPATSGSNANIRVLAAASN